MSIFSWRTRAALLLTVLFAVPGIIALILGVVGLNARWTGVPAIEKTGVTAAVRR